LTEFNTMDFSNLRKWLGRRLGNNYFEDSPKYWEDRYSAGGNSGAGSYDKLATFKAKVINKFVVENSISSVLEFGCGDGHQLSLANYPSYTGLDVSKTSIKMCAEKFSNDKSKNFFIYDSRAFVDNTGIFRCDLVLSLDVIYHVVEDDIFEAYMQHVFSCSNRYVIIYSSDYDFVQTSHVRHRNFTKWVKENVSGWKQLKHIKNEYPYDPNDEYSTSADFFIYQKDSAN
jgi:SAM-dependent methyltransferase